MQFNCICWVFIAHQSYGILVNRYAMKSYILSKQSCEYSRCKWFLFFNKYFIFKICIQYEVSPLFHKSAIHKSNMEFITVRFASIWNKKEAYVWILIRIILKIIWNNPNWQDILFPTHWTLRLCTVAFRNIFELLLSVKNIFTILGQQQRNTFCLKAWLLYTVFYLTRLNQILNLNLDENENLTWIFNDNISIYLSLYHFSCNLFPLHKWNGQRFLSQIPSCSS